MKIKIFLFLILSCIMIIYSNCKKKLFSHLSCNGYVINLNTNLPVQGAIVTLKACGGGDSDSWDDCPSHKFKIGNATTDATGHFIIEGKKSRIDEYFYVVKHNNAELGVNTKGFHENSLSNDTLRIDW
jgi:hypothetical protein